jgi:bifunctional NMN adenylyltransferase/nudix hydrolase
MIDLAVFIGRFQPFHLAHQEIVDEALAIADKVLILIGSSFEPRSLRNPWFYDEREAMIRSCYTPEENARIICEPLVDIRYNDASWLSQVQRVVYDHQPHPDAKITLIGRHSQGTGYYTSQFPQWDNTAVNHGNKTTSTEIRNHLFSGGSASALTDKLPETLITSLGQFMATDAGKTLQQDYAFIQQYKKGWENVPFEPTHITVDAVVIQSGHVLLVKRGAQPGKGLLALPGGFIHHEETLMDAMIRKLKEETQIKVPAPVLIGSVKHKHVFDDPFRSARGRTITHAFHIELRGEESLPKIKGGGDASNCFWLPLGQLDSTQMFEDHYFIIQKMLGTL